MSLQARSAHASSPTAPVAHEGICSILSAKELDRLRRAFRPEEVIGPSRKTIVGTFPPVEGYADSFLSYFFSEGGASPAGAVSTLTPLERERIIITLQALRLRGNGRYLGIHLYWGLMTGLSVQEIADQIFLISVYSGIDVYTATMNTFSVLLSNLKECAASKDPSRLTATSILKATAKWFPIS